MQAGPLPSGAFVWCNFPFGPPHRPDRPGPIRHIVYVLGAAEPGRGLLVAYTSSGPWRGGSRNLPLGVVEFDEAAARSLNQRAFHLDLRCLARVPLGPAWFPDLDTPTRGVVAIAGKRLRERILKTAEELAERSPRIIEVRGAQ